MPSVNGHVSICVCEFVSVRTKTLTRAPAHARTKTILFPGNLEDVGAHVRQFYYVIAGAIWIPFVRLFCTRENELYMYNAKCDLASAHSHAHTHTYDIHPSSSQGLVEKLSGGFSAQPTRPDARRKACEVVKQLSASLSPPPPSGRRV